MAILSGIPGFHRTSRDRVKIVHPPSLLAKESKPALDARLGFSKMSGFQHGGQYNIGLYELRSLQLLSDSMEGKCMLPAPSST